MAQLNEEIVTFFRGNSTGLADTINRVNSLVEGQARRERIVSEEIRRIRERQEKDMLLSPIRQQLAAQRSADARVQAERDAATRIERIRKASTASGLSRELRANFGNNAQKKIGGYLQDTLGLSQDAAEGLVGRVGKLAPLLTVAGTAGAALWKTFQASNRLAGEQAGKLNAISEGMRRSSAINMFSSSAEGIDSLASKLSGVREQILAARQAQRDNDPYGFGGGVMGGMKTVLGNAQSSLKSAVGLGPYNNFDQQEDAKNTLILQERIKEQERAKLQRQINDASSREVELTKLDVMGGRAQVELLRLRADLEGKIASARAKQAGPSVLRDIEEQNRLLRTQAKLRFRSEYGAAIESNLSANIAPGIGQELQRAQVARLGLQFQHRLALSRPGGMFKTEALDWQTKLKGADMTINSAALDLKRRTDAIAAERLEIANRRELVNLGHQDIESQTKLADLDTQAALATREQTYNLRDYIKANGEVQKAVAARLGLEKQNVAVQHAQSELAYDLARRTGEIEATNNGELRKKASITEETIASMRQELTLSQGLSTARRRELELGVGSGENDLRLMRQERAYGKTPLGLQREMLAERNRKRKLDLFDKRQERDDGLTRIERDMNGNILGGVDILTGERRAASERSRLLQGARSGLQTGGLTTGGLNANAFQRPQESNAAVNIAQRMLTAQLDTKTAIDNQTQKFLSAIDKLAFA